MGLTNMLRQLTALSTLLVTLIQGCATAPPEISTAAGLKKAAPVTQVSAPANDEGWWRVSLFINWPRDQDPHWHTDLLLAHQLVAPVIVVHEKDITVWRFHRRAARDETGHRFSFIFYSQREVANRIYADIQNNPVLEKLKTSGVVVGDSYRNDFVIAKPFLEDTSDEAWSPLMRKVWPVYSNGISQMWLTMIDIYAGQWTSAHGDASLEELDEFYRQVDRAITRVWHEEGQHALLHHLNAIFAYQPLLLRERRDARF